MKRGVRRNVRRVKMAEMPVTNTIIAINVAVFVLTYLVTRFAKTPITERNLGLNPIALHQGDWWRIVTSGFLHFEIWHIGFNMLILYRLGETFERRLGTARFLGLFSVCLLGGSAGAVAIDPVFSLTGGASGAVFGLIGAAVVSSLLRGERLNNSQWGPLLIINLVITFAIPGISKGGHLGGLLFGAVAGAFLLNPKRRQRGIAEDITVLAVLAVIAVVAAVSFANSRSANFLNIG
jgi:membrane associated rhomboid family serine protease